MTDKTGKANGWPTTETECCSVRDQLERILKSPLFLHSRHYPDLLRYVVERTLEGSADTLKERTIGIDVFGRDPLYDTNLDNIVRNTSTRVRKRLAQYYQNSTLGTELRIDLPAGSYVPRFTPASMKISWKPEPVSLRRRYGLHWLGVAATICIAAAWMLRSGHSQISDMDAFWKPVLNSNGSVLLCVGSSNIVRNPMLTRDLVAGSMGDANKADFLRNVPISSAIALSRFVGYLQSNGKPFLIRQHSEVVYDDFQQGPAILVGANINPWAYRLTGHLRFTFHIDPDKQLRLLVDNQSQPPREWTSTEENGKLTRDYALVSRFLDPATGTIIVSSGGLHRFGGTAAAEFVTNENSLKQLDSIAPEWVTKLNMQVVLTTEVIENSPGKPRVLVAHFW